MMSYKSVLLMVMSESESAIDDIVKGIMRLMALPFSETLDEFFIKTLPKKYAEPAEHLINARIELLSTFRSLLDKRIERLKEVRERVKGKAEEVTKKEKVQVE
jgi:predicted ribosome quality control (RQC) complex YloA/Tae2 family protein